MFDQCTKQEKRKYNFLTLNDSPDLKVKRLN